MAKRRQSGRQRLGKTTVGRSVMAGIDAAGGRHTASDLGIRLSDRVITGETGRGITAAVARMSGLRQKVAAGPGGGRTEVVWNGEKLKRILQMEMSKRLKLCSQLVKDQTKRNLSKPVLKYKTTVVREGKRKTETRVLRESRSIPGEFPRADTTLLKKTVFHELVNPEMAVVGTPLDYGLLLETRMDRSFLRRTLSEMQPRVRQILVKPITSFGTQ